MGTNHQTVPNADSRRNPMSKKIELPFVRSPYNYDRQAACDECCIEDFGPSMTQQSQAEEADINTIVKRFGLTGKMPDNIRVPQTQTSKTSSTSRAHRTRSPWHARASTRCRQESEQGSTTTHRPSWSSCMTKKTPTNCEQWDSRKPKPRRRRQPVQLDLAAWPQLNPPEPTQGLPEPHRREVRYLPPNNGDP